MAAADVVSGAIPALPTATPPDDETERVIISATVLSSDLFTPYQEPRVTLPTIGEQQQALQPLGGRSWGGSLADYGGIGGLSHLGIHRVKDLPVSRSHRHYQSGLTKHDGGPQPYRQTQLKFSDCRVNDQRLPPPLKTDPSKLEWERHDPSSWPGFHAYTSHRPRFEVFPSGDTDQPHIPTTAAQSTPGTRLSQPLSESTKTAISNLNRRLYQRTSYQDSFPDYTIELRRTAAASLPSRLKKLGVMPAYPGSEFGDSMYFPVFSDGTESTITEQTVRAKGRDFEDKGVNKGVYRGADGGEKGEDETVADEGDQEESERADAEIAAMPETPPPSEEGPASDTSRFQKSRSTNKSVSFNETPQIMEDTIKKFTIAPNKPMTGVGPCWPPSTSHIIDGINGSQLLERNDITQFPPAYRSALKQTPEIRPPTPPKGGKSTRATVVTIGGTSPAPKIPPAPPFNPSLMRHDLAVKRSAPLQPLSASQKALAMLSQYDDYDDEAYRELNLPDDNSQPFLVPHGYPGYCHSGMRKSAPPNLPSLKKTKSNIFNWSAPSSKRPLALPPAPLSDSLTPSGRRVPHRLGLRYKTEAHKRYHSVHPDSVPDLRNSRHGYGGKRYFFYDSHSSVFRG